MAANSPYYEVGLYVCQVVSQALGVAKSGNSQIILKVKVLGRPIVDSSSYEPVSQQYERSIWMTVTSKTIPFVKEALEVLGFHGMPSELDPQVAKHHSLVGQTVDCWCKHEQDLEGNLREKWQISTGSPSGVINATPLPVKQLRQLDALWARNVDTGRSVAAPRAATAVAERQQYDVDTGEITDDDIPF